MPFSKDPRRQKRQLANLRTGPPAPKGNRLAVRHGGYAAIARDRIEARQRDVLDALSADAPLRDASGDLPRHDGAQVALLAEVLVRLDDLNAYLSARGYLDGKGKVRPAAELAGRLRREAADYLDALGMTPKSRAKLGLDLHRTFDLAAHWALEDDEQHHDGDDEEHPRSDAEPHGLPPSQLGHTPENGACHGEGDDDA